MDDVWLESAVHWVSSPVVSNQNDTRIQDSRTLCNRQSTQEKFWLCRYFVSRSRSDSKSIVGAIPTAQPNPKKIASNSEPEASGERLCGATITRRFAAPVPHFNLLTASFRAVV